MEMILGGRKTETIQNYETVVSAWYDAYGTDILRYCFMMLGNRTDAEDATQETFLKAWRNIGRYEARNGCSPKSWIIRIAGNTCRDYLRRAWHKYESRLITPEDLQKLGNAPDESRELIMDVMNLPEKYREVVLLVFMQGMTVREAAECMQTSASTISRRLEKARKMIA
jgi:RNA polymerase sigma-70 factor (ECF subfamily)